MTEFRDDMTLAEARDAFRELLMPEGEFSNAMHPCPCCRRQAKIYRRKIHAHMARGLIVAYGAGGGENFIHAPTLVSDYQNTDFARMTYWGLVREADGEREDGGRAGWYMLTPAGVDFVLKRRFVQKYVLIYDDRVLGRRGENVYIDDALGEKFNYADLMAGR